MLIDKEKKKESNSNRTAYKKRQEHTFIVHLNLIYVQIDNILER